MKLSDVMSAANLSDYAETALIIFAVVFVVVTAYTLRPWAKAEYDAAARLPLDGDGAETPRPAPSSASHRP